MASSSDSDKSSDENILPLEAMENDEDEELEVIFVNATTPAVLQESSSSADMGSSMAASSNASSNKFLACGSSSSSASVAARISPMMCAYHVNSNRITPIIGGKPVSNLAMKNSKVKRKSDNDQTPSMGKKQCQSSCNAVGGGGGSMEDNECYEYDECVLDSHVDIPFSPTFSPAENKTAPAVVVAPEISDWVATFTKWTDNQKLQALSALIPNCGLNHIRHVHKTIQPYFRRDFIALLPKELSLQVLSYLDPAELLNVALVCRYWRTLTEDIILWREKCLEEGICPDSLPSPPSGSPAASLCFARCPWKSVYLRHSRVEMNWRRGTLRRELVLRGHDDHVITCLQICGDKIVSGSDDNTLKVWSANSGCNVVTMVGHSGGVWSSQISDEGDLVISGSTDRTVKVWDMNTGECLRTFFGHTSTVRCMALRGDILVSGSRDATLRVWDIRTGECLHVLTGHLAAVRCVQFDGRRAVSGAYDCAVKVWDVEKETCLHTLEGHTNRVYSLQFDSERNIIVSGSLDTSIRVWDIVGGQCLYTLIGHQSLTSGMQLRGNILVSGNADSTIKVWDISNGQCLHTLAGNHRHQSAVTSLQFLQNGLVVSSSDDGSVKLWDALTGQFLRDVVRLPSCGAGGCIWRLRATPTTLLCAVGSRNGTEDTKLLVLDFNSDYP